MKTWNKKEVSSANVLGHFRKRSSPLVCYAILKTQYSGDVLMANGMSATQIVTARKLTTHGL
jgi:hypothetical protein